MEKRISQKKLLGEFLEEHPEFKILNILPGLLGEASIIYSENQTKAIWFSDKRRVWAATTEIIDGG